MLNGTLLSNDVSAILRRITTIIWIPDCMHISSTIATYLGFPTRFSHLSSFRVFTYTGPTYCNYLLVFSIYPDFLTQLDCHECRLESARIS